MKLLNQFRNSSIRFKLSLIVILNGSLALLLVGVFLLVYEKYELHEAAAQELSTRADIVANGSTAALSFADPHDATETLLALRSDATLLEAAIYDKENRLFAWYERVGNAGPPERPLPIGATFADGSLLVSRAIMLRGQPIGTVFLKTSMGELDARLRSHIAIVCLVLFAVLGLKLLLSARMLGTIIDPLVQLATLARFVSVERNYSVRATPQWGDEVGFLIDSFNEMLAQIEARERAQKTAEEALRESEERFALAARGANDGLWDWQRSTNRIYLSPRGNQMFGYPEADRYWTQAEWRGLVHPSDRERVGREWTEGIRAGQEEFVAEYRIRDQNNASIWVLSRGRSVKDASGTVIRVAGSITDITEGKIADSLTGVHSRFYFLDRLESAIESARYSGIPFAVLFLDLDRFKLVNDSLGHAAGDELLVEIAWRLRNSVQAGGSAAERAVVARLGGDEFAVLLNGLHEAEAVALAQKTLQQLGAPFLLRGRQILPGVSIGIALNGSGTTPEDVLRSADTAMYHAKQTGRGKVEVFDEEMRNRAVARIEIEADLREAIEQKQLVLFYQPQVMIPGGRVVGFEALVRWKHPQRGMVQPGEFISIAEETGLIIPLGRWVLREACSQMASWHQEFALDATATISVNVSYMQLKEPGFVEDVKRILIETGLPPESLRLEMTESTVMNDAEATAATLERLKRLNVGLEIDDFGTGYSSLSCLKGLPFDTIKIDRSFVRELGGNEAASEIVRAILKLARSMSMTVVAEGVETSDQLQALDTLGCAYAQGFLFSKPISAAAATLLVEEEEFRRGFGQIEAGMRQVDFASREYAEISADTELVPVLAGMEGLER